jgi:hypothetical protein
VTIRAANAANGNGTNVGDHIYTGRLLRPAAPASKPRSPRCSERQRTKTAAATTPPADRDLARTFRPRPEQPAPVSAEARPRPRRRHRVTGAAWRSSGCQPDSGHVHVPTACRSP